jgi:DNA-binding CsgD family transcriptional regulator
VLHTIGPLGAVMATLGDTEHARPLHARATALASATSDPGQIGWNAAVAHLTEVFEGRFRAAASIVDPVVDPAPRDADIATPWRTLTDWFLGRWELGRADCAVVRERFPVAPSAHMAWAFSMAALFETAMAASPSSQALLGPAARTYGQRDLYFFTGLHHWATGLCHWIGGDAARAAPHLRRAIAWLGTTGAVGFEGLLIADLPECLVQIGETAEAEAVAARAGELSTRLRTVFASAQAAYADGVVAAARGHRRPAVEAFTTAADGYAEAEAPFYQARALEHRADLEPSGRLADLSAAARLYDGLPAPRHRERVVALLRTNGAAGRRAAQHVGALTAREREIATLASRGLVTQDIADRLHLSVRTVETHLGRVYRKLGIDGRAALADALASG